MMQGAQPRLSLLSVAELTLGRRQEAIVEPTMGGRLVMVDNYHASLIDQTIDRPIHTYPTCVHCPGCLPGWHYCKDSGRVVQHCEDCEITKGSQVPVTPSHTTTTSTPVTTPKVPTSGTTMKSVAEAPQTALLTQATQQTQQRGATGALATPGTTTAQVAVGMPGASAVASLNTTTRVVPSHSHVFTPSAGSNGCSRSRRCRVTCSHNQLCHHTQHNTSHSGPNH